MGRALPDGEAAFNVYCRVLRYEAEKRRKIPFSLTKEQIRQITSKPCEYCGAPPAQLYNASKARRGPYVYNGIDRIDSNLGYIYENCAPCCGRCNLAKHQMSVEEFLAHAEKIIEHQRTRSVRGKTDKDYWREHEAFMRRHRKDADQ